MLNSARNQSHWGEEDSSQSETGTIASVWNPLSEIISFQIAYPTVRHLDEKQASKYEFDFDDEDDDFLLITIDGIYKQIYIGRDIPINYNNCSLSVQPLVEEIKEDMQYYLEWIYFARFISYRLYVIVDYMIIYKYLVWKFQFEFSKIPLKMVKCAYYIVQ